jgi:hypothetical protein
LWQISGVPPGSIFDIACAWLPNQDYDLAGLGKDYGLDLSQEAPICQKDANGKFMTPPARPADGVTFLGTGLVIARSGATKQSRNGKSDWIASLRSQ